MRNETVGCLALAGGFALAGSSVVAASFIVGLPVFSVSAAGALVSLVILVPLALREPGPGLRALAAAVPLLAAQAFFGIVLFRVLMLEALGRIGAANAGLTTSVTPVITAVFSFFFLKERIGGRVMAGIALVVLGIAALQAGDSGTLPVAGQALAGCLFALGAVAESLFNVLSKRLPVTIGPRQASALVMALAFVVLAALSLASGERVAWSTVGDRQMLAVIYMGLFSSALAYILWFAGIARVPVSVAAAFSGVMPLAAFVLSIGVLGEEPRTLAFAGAALTIGGIFFCTTGHKAGVRLPRVRRGPIRESPVSPRSARQGRG